MPKYQKNYVKKPLLNVEADIVWASAYQAFVDNDNRYVKYVEPGEEGTTNRAIVDELIKDPSQIKEESYENGRKVRDYYKAYTFKILQGIKISDFDNNAMVIANRDIIDSNFDLAIITSLPASYQKSKVRDEAQNRVRFAKGGLISTVGSKVNLDIEVLKSVYSHNYGVFFVTGITEQDQPVFFSHKTGMDIGKKVTIYGTVKAHPEGITQLNRVKVL